MRFKKFYLALTMLIAAGALFQPHARADEENQTTKMTFSAPVEIPGQVLPAGSYIFERADDNDLPNVVRIFNADRTVLYATLETNPVDRMSPTDNPSITLAEQGSGNPAALVRWFYPGSLTGHELVYPTNEAKELAQAKLDTFIANKLVNAAAVAGE
jgi:hypothetical protein